MSSAADNADRIDRAQERLRIAARLYQLRLREPESGRPKCAISLCHGARVMADNMGRRDLARWALKCAKVCEGVDT